MGMDVYGVNLTVRVNTKKPERPKDMHKGASRDVVDKYFKEEQEYEDKNPGVYFRNNCWWWRPLANFIIENCDWLTQEQQATASRQQWLQVLASRSRDDCRHATKNGGHWHGSRT